MGLTSPKRYESPKALTLSPHQGWPTVSGSVKVLNIPPKALVGMDLEYKINENPYRPYLASLAYRETDGSIRCVAGEFTRFENLLQILYHNPNITFVGHNVLSADCDVLSKWWGFGDMPEGGVKDTLLAHYLLNQHLCHASKEIDEITLAVEYRRGPGKLRLGSMLAQYMEWANYKDCRGDKDFCFGPCPKHDEAGYNGLDAGAPLACWDIMIEEARSFTSEYYPTGVPFERNHDHLVRLQHALNHMPPIPVHMPTVEQLNIDLEEKKFETLPCEEVEAFSEKTGRKLKNPKIEWYYGFNPDSPKQVKEFFNARGFKLKKSALEDISAALASAPASTDPLTLEALERLKTYKKYGKGYKSWYDPSVLHPHPELGEEWQSLQPEYATYGGAMGRPVSSKPNCMNFPKRGFMAAMRKALKAPPGFKYLKFDAKQGELRVFGYIGGVDPMDMGDDAFTFVVEQCDGLFERVAQQAKTEYNKKPRNACKQMVHAYDYGEGMRLMAPGSWLSGRRQKEWDEGALLVYEDWTYKDKVVCFDGANLAKRLFGDASYEHRRLALEAQATFARLFPAAVRAQKKIMEASLKGYVVTPSGHLLKLYGDDRDNIKQALAMNGQCTLSAYMQEIVLIYSPRSYPPVIYIQDELGSLVPADMTYSEAIKYLKDASHESRLISGFRCPMDMEWGPSYGELVAASA